MTFAMMIYLAGVATTIQVVSIFTTLITAFGTVVLIATHAADYHKEKTLAELKKWSKRLFIGCVVSTIVMIFTPSEKTLYMLAGADVAGQVQVADKTSPVLNKTLELIEQKLDEELKGAKQEK